MSTKTDAYFVETDMHLEEGVFEVGARYYIRTPTYQYVGTLMAVTGSVFVFSETATVYETGSYADFFSGKGKDVQPHGPKAGSQILDRAGTALQKIGASLYK